MAKNGTINVKGTEISLFILKETDYISLTAMTVSFKEGSGLIGKWITNKNTLEYLGIWEKINNLDFNYPEFGVIEQTVSTDRMSPVGNSLANIAKKPANSFYYYTNR